MRGSKKSEQSGCLRNNPVAIDAVTGKGTDMQRRTLGLCVSLLVSALGAGYVARAQQPKRVDDNSLKNAAKNGDEWATYGRDYAETHYSPLKQIDATNVQRLGLAWSWETESPTGGRIESTPLE